MLQFLVTSKARRRLLVLLWGEKKRGSVTELAELADVSFASAHAELREMQRLQLVRVVRDGKEVFSANLEHPQADFLAQLASSEAPTLPQSTERDEELKKKLVGLGAPLRGVRASRTAPADVLQTLFDSMGLARRDAVVARCLPVCFWKQRDRLDAKALHNMSATAEDKHAFGFFLDVTSELGGDRRLSGVAEALRDHRLTQLRPFFYSTTSPKAAREFPLAKKWGFSMNMDPGSFRALFEKFVVT